MDDFKLGDLPPPKPLKPTPKWQIFLGDILKYGSLIIASFVAVVPLVIIFFGSLKTGEEFRRTGAITVPESWTNFDNYRTAFDQGSMTQGFMNTAIILLFSVAGSVILGSMAAYVIDRFDFRLRPVVTGLFLLATLVPGITTQVATFQIVNWFQFEWAWEVAEFTIFGREFELFNIDFQMYNTRWAPIILFMGTDIIALYIFLQFLRGISTELDEAAIIDGASYFTIYRKIIFPLLRPAIATVMIIKGVGVYNDFYTAFLYMPKRSLGVISTALFRFLGPYGSKWELISAGIMIAILPTLIVFIFLQRYIYNGFTSGSVK